MTILGKKQMSEEDIKLNFITPAIQRGWKGHITMETRITDGRINIRGNIVVRSKPKFADYLLYLNDGKPIAVVEAKDNNHSVSHGLQQAMTYAQMMDLPFAYSSNGDAFYEHDFLTGQEQQIALEKFPTQDELIARYYAELNGGKGISALEKKIVTQPYYSSQSTYPPRYYQRNAVNRTVEAIARGQQRLLLVMATGTGKTYTAFQIVYRLLRSDLKKRVLYLADRNILVDQSILQDFAPLEKTIYKVDFSDKECLSKIASHEVNFALYHQMVGQNDEEHFRQIPVEYFDLIIVDECHRGSAKEDSNWRRVLEYFTSATQIGMTATPKESEKVSNIDYFGEPVYIYSLKQGIEDGFLAPFKVINITTNIGDGWRPYQGQTDIFGNVIEDRIYNNRDYDYTIILQDRIDEVAREITEYLKSTDRMQKTIVFCASEDHAERMRVALVNDNQDMVWMLFLKVYDAKEDDWELNEDNYESIIPEALRWRNWAKADSNGHAMTGDKLLNFVNNILFPVLKGNDVKDGDAVLYEGIKVTPDTPIKKAIVKSAFEDANNYMKDGVYLRQVIDVIDEIAFDDVKESHAFGFVYEEILRELQSAGSSGEFYTPRAVTEFMALMIKPQLGEKMADFACGTGGFITSWLGQLSGQVTDTTAQKQLDDSIYGVEKKPFPYLLCVTNMLLHDIEVPNIYHMNSLKHNLLDYTDEDKFDVILMNPPYGGHEDKSIQGFFPDDLASAETADLFLSVIMYRLKKNGRAAVVVPDGFLFGLDNAKVNIKKKLISQFNLHTVVRLPGSVFSPYTSITTNLLFFDNTKPTTETWFYRVDIPSDRKHFSKTKPMELKHFDDCIAWWNDRKEIPDGENFKAQKFTAEYLLNEQGCNIDLCGYPHEEEEILDPLDTIREYQERRTTLNAEIDKVLAELEALLPGGVSE